MSDPFIGEIRPFGFDFAPRNWARCDGSLLPISSNTALFSLLGTIYGGDGRTTFALPDLRSRTALHYGNGPGISSYRIGQRGGVETVTLTALQMPAHNHAQPDTAPGTGKMRAVASPASASDPTGNTLGLAAAYNSDAPTVDMAVDSVVVDPIAHGNTDNTGGSQAHDNMPPNLVVNYCICLQGMFPPRS